MTIVTEHPDRLAGFRSTSLYDTLTRAPLIAYFILCAVAASIRLYRHIGSSNQFGVAQVLEAVAGLAGLGFLLLVAATLVTRVPPIARAAGVLPRAVAIGGTFSIVTLALFPRAELSVAATIVSLLLIVVGYGWASFAVAHLGRSLSIMAEARRLVVAGPYAVVRHPLYLGEALASLGVLFQLYSPVAVLVWLVHIALQCIRMHSEERLLRTIFPEYEVYAVNVARVIPRLY